MNEENLYLQKVENFIKKQLSSYAGDILELKEYIREERRRMWDDFVKDSTEPDMFELVQITQTEQRDEQRYLRIEDDHAVMLLLAGSPYFARLDISEDGDKETLYIGRRSLIDNETSDVLVCDWRADISSMYYECEPGPAHYKSPYGDIECKLLLKRQFKIEDGEIKYMFDSDVAIEDEILKSELSKTSDNRLKSIISTIQKEQNTIIRNTKDKLVLVSGVAGSGKTSIALHRLAYMLYKYRNSLNSNEIIIFSPNNVFNSYIADVLPDLGENKVVQTSFYEYFSTGITGYALNDGAAQTESVLDGSADLSGVVKKGSGEFASFLNKFCTEKFEILAHFEDIDYYGQSVRTADEIRFLYLDEYKNFPPEIRKNKILDGIDEYLETELHDSHIKEYTTSLTEGGIIGYSDEELDAAINELWIADKTDILKKCSELLTVDAVSLYVEAVKEFYPELYNDTKSVVDRGALNFEDLLCVAYIRTLAGQMRVQHKIKQIVIDEAQDYPPVLYSTVALLFPDARYTVVGDIQQALIRHYKSLSEIAQCFATDSKAICELTKSYRSTVEINEYVSRLSKSNADFSFFERHGDGVGEIPVEELCDRIICTASDGMSTRAVICKTDNDCTDAQKLLSENGVKSYIVGRDDLLYTDRIIVIPCSMIKGLEFDEVFVWKGTDDVWVTESERHALFVSASRAMHRLTITK